MLTPINQVIPQSNIIVFSPHFDDALFLIGNYALGMKDKSILKTKNIKVIVLFAKSNYLAGTGEGNFDTSLDRLKFATGKRLLEDLNCLDQLFGDFGYQYQIVGEKECFVRAKPFADSEMEFPQGSYKDFDAEDWNILNRMKERIVSYATNDDTALIFPLAIKEHIDHFIVREAALKVAKELGTEAKAAFYFQEDKPYGGIATKEEMRRADQFVAENNFKKIIYEAWPDMIIDFAFKYYISQVEEVYKAGILNRSKVLKEEYKFECMCDQMYLYYNS